ncbi:MAG TPA: SIMPL domain-containing protein [Rhizomicrobium sp.]|nr:SIMPL domain-containing protein [Rhizomicrobium sp.]
MHRIGPSLRVASLFIAPLAFAAVAISPATALAADPEPHTITVSGEGEVKAVPDEAVLTAGVESTGATAEAALDANRRAMTNVFATLKRQGIPDKSIQTSEFNVSPQYETENHNRQHIVGYQASNTVEITIDDIPKLGAAIDALVASGANSMGGVSFTIRDPKPLLKQAREAAVKDAMDRAETYAQAAGLSVGPVVQVSEGTTQPPRPMFRTMAGLGNVMTPVAAGEQTVSAQVTMTFEIK